MINRKSNFELLRLFCSFSVLTYHFVNTRLELSELSMITQIFVVNFFYSGGRIAVNIFVIIGSYFLIESKFKLKRIISLWLSTLFYSIFIGLIYFIQYRDIIFFVKSCLPILSNAVWFVGCYLLLLLFMPLLNNLINDGRKLKFYCNVLFIIYCCLGTLWHTGWISQITNVSWFFILYIFTAYIKKNENKKIICNKTLCLVLFFVCYCFISFYYVFYDSIKINFLSKTFFFDNLQSIPVLIASFSLFLFFKNLNIKNTNVINFLSKTTLDAYILLSLNNPSGSLFWCDFLPNYNFNFYLILFYLILFGVFNFSILIGHIRLFIISKILRIHFINKISKDIDTYFNQGGTV